MKLGGDRAEGRLELGAEIGDNGNDRQRDTGGDQPVFDRGGAGVVFQESHQKAFHDRFFLKPRDRTRGEFTWRHHKVPKFLTITISKTRPSSFSVS